MFEENVEGANVAILRSNTVAADSRTEWIAKKVNTGVNIIICSIRLVEVGIDLIMTPTLMFYQFDWSMFIMAQAAKRAFELVRNKSVDYSILLTQIRFKKRWLS